MNSDILCRTSPVGGSDMIEIMINKQYGGYSFSEAAIDEYNKRNLEIDPSFVLEKYNGDQIDVRSKIMIDICKEFGEKANSQYSNIKIYQIKKKYENFYKISEYDGMENIIIDFDKYKLHSIDEILLSSIGIDKKLEKIKEIVNMKILPVEDKPIKKSFD